MGKARGTVGQRVAWLREYHELSQRDLAEKSGVSFGFISRIERGERQPTIETIRKLATPLEVDPHYLETGDVNGTWVYVPREEKDGVGK